MMHRKDSSAKILIFHYLIFPYFLSLQVSFLDSPQLDLLTTIIKGICGVVYLPGFTGITFIPLALEGMRMSLQRFSKRE